MGDERKYKYEERYKEEIYAENANGKISGRKVKILSIQFSVMEVARYNREDYAEKSNLYWWLNLFRGED